jgi:hypothetical protein
MRSDFFYNTLLLRELKGLKKWKCQEFQPLISTYQYVNKYPKTKSIQLRCVDITMKIKNTRTIEVECLVRRNGRRHNTRSVNPKVRGTEFWL